MKFLERHRGHGENRFSLRAHFIVHRFFEPLLRLESYLRGLRVSVVDHFLAKGQEIGL